MTAGTRRLRAARLAAYLSQGGFCCYCSCPTWLTAPQRFGACYGLTEEETRKLQATAEHLVARCDGGGDEPGNIACACVTCNTGRHACKRPLTAERYLLYVVERMARGAWHTRRVLARVNAGVADDSWRSTAPAAEHTIGPRYAASPRADGAGARAAA